MLNKNNQRELCYVVTVDEIKELPGYDRVESARINGWWCIVPKKQFSVGDLGIYFEIDSRVPSDNPAFGFMEKRHYKVKTQKMCKSISQGLLMHPTDFGWNIINNEIIDEKENHYKNGDFLTQRLGIVYASEEDNKRKKEPNATTKIQKILNTHPKLAKSKFGKWCKKHAIPRAILCLIFGRNIKKLEFPYWVVKTDEERCLWKDTKIITNKGNLRIADIVNKKLDVKVLSYNVDTNNIEYKSIIDYQKFPIESNLIKIKFPYRFMVNRQNSLICTSDHRLFTQNGWTMAKNLKNSDNLYMLIESIPNEMIEYLYGHILGDGHLILDKRNNGSKVGFDFCQGELHREYVELLNKIYASTTRIKTEYSRDKPENKIYKFSINKLDNLSYFLNKDGCISNNKFTVTKEFCNRLTKKSLAVWYLDDGSCSFDGNKLKKSIEISSYAFSKEENELLADTLRNKFGLECRVNEGKYYSIIFYSESSIKFFEMIADYVPKSMKYKLPEYLRDRYCKLNDLKFVTEQMILPISIEEISMVNPKGSNYVYDIEVEDNHTFFASKVVNHNCQNLPLGLIEDYSKMNFYATEKIDGTSFTATMKRKRKEFYICSRNVVMNNKANGGYYEDNVYTKIAEKYDIKNVLKDILSAHKDFEFITIQGEIYGSGIQKRDYSRTDIDLAVFNIIYSINGKVTRLNPYEMYSFADKYSLPCVPILGKVQLPNDRDKILDMAGGESRIDGKRREGLVFRSENGVYSFKAVDNDYLLSIYNK